MVSDPIGPTAEGASPGSETAGLFDELTFELALVYFRLTETARELLGQGRHSSGRRSVLRSLGRHGPRTISHMAADRAVSRQHVHTLVRELERDGLVTLRVNPKDRRSKNVALTARGRRFLKNMAEREKVFFADLGAGIPPADASTTVAVLRELRTRLEQATWRRPE